jgi:hypothetical protein
MTVFKCVDDIPAVCLEDDLINVFRLSRSDMRMWRKYPDFLPFPPLPMLDRQIRVSGLVVAWFLAQEASDYYRRFRSPLDEKVKGLRRNRPPWWKFAPPHAAPYWARPLEGETASLGVSELAATLRTNTSAIRRVIRLPDFPMPPATEKPLRWTAGQLERLLWAPQDHDEHQERLRQSAVRSRRIPR